MHPRPRLITHPPNAGLGLVEIVVVAGIISIVFLGLVQLVVLTLQPVGESVRKAEATYFAEEGMEAVKVLRNEDWSTYVSPLANDTTYYPVISSNRWTLTATNPGPINGTYTRTVELEAVYRDIDDNIATTGTLDENTRKVISTVSWNDRGNTRNVIMEAYITNFLGT